MRAILVAALLVVASTAGARADDFLKSSPGELAIGHASLDKQAKCSSCHDTDNVATSAKCIGCHDAVRAKVSAGKGFHSSVKVRGHDCKECHKEHRGRTFDLMGWTSTGGMQAFDHELAGWKLQGKHAVVDCTRCHKTVDHQGLRTFVGTDNTCGGCHSKDQPHGGIRQTFMRCDRCHSDKVWTPQKTRLDFDHDSADQAAMPLEGRHADVACGKCHPKALFKLASFDKGECSQCHKSPHDGQLFGTKGCKTCHSAALRSMKDIRFDHKKQTGYTLAGKHASIECASCHLKSMGTTKPADSCESCHARDNKHGNRFDKLPKCSTCHSQRAWKGAFQFNHADNTKFALTGKHANAPCRECHRGKTPSDFERFEIKNGCMSCHKHGKAHGGKFKNDQCLTCHAEGGSKKMRKDSLETFHGEKSKFPLRNGHAGVQCQMCHVNDVYQETPRECGVNCHEDSLHRGSLGEDCSRCHEPGKWPAVRFDHTKQTKWPLQGKHAAIKSCDSCHAGRQYHGAPTSCSSAGCHKNDDVHQTQLGNKCEKCHSTDGTMLFRHNRDSAFKIDGKHQPLVCAACHKTIAFKPVRSDCFGCHAEPAVHKGRYGVDCAKCHSTQTFTDTKALHDVGDFSLSGAHDQLECAKCHPRGEKLRGSGNLCITCHRKDDIHKNALSPKCGDCHTQRAFAPARFDHMTVGCGLLGLHATLPCADCHKNGNYGAVSPMCVSCHRSDAQKVRQPDHRSLFECGSCHNPSAWIPATQLGQQTICR